MASNYDVHSPPVNAACLADKQQLPVLQSSLRATDSAAGDMQSYFYARIKERMDYWFSLNLFYLLKCAKRIRQVKQIY